MFGDRGSGGREGKQHDRRTLRKITNTFNKSSVSQVVAPQLNESPACIPLGPRRSDKSLIDCGCNLLSRQLLRDQSRILQRASSDNVDAIITFCTDFDRIQELRSIVTSNSGLVYGCYGIHSDNIKRNINDKFLATSIDTLKQLALTPDCCALFASLDFSRDIASHYSMEKLLDAQVQLAHSIKLPIVIQEVEAMERIIEKIQEFLDSNVHASEGADAAEPPFQLPIAIFDYQNSLDHMMSFLNLRRNPVTPVIPHIILSGVICDDSSEKALALRSMVPFIPLRQLLIASNSPLATPQNIPDHFIRTTRNEPSTLPYLLPVLCQAWNTDLSPDTSPTYEQWLEKGSPEGKEARPYLQSAQMSLILYENSVRFFQLQSNDSGQPQVPGSGSVVDSSSSKPSEEEVNTDSQENEPSPLAEAPNDALSPSFMQSLSVTYLCKICRFSLFTDEDVQRHDKSGISPSVKSGLRGGVNITKLMSGISTPSIQQHIKTKGAGGSSDHPNAPSSSKSQQSDDVREIAVSRWHTAKGKHIRHKDEGTCRQLLIDPQPWMNLDPSLESEGSFSCPGCRSKIGHFSFTGIKCSCGLNVIPAFKIPKARVDEVYAADLSSIQEGDEEAFQMDPVELALTAAAMEQRTALDDEDDRQDENDDDDARTKKKDSRSKRLVVPVNKYRGNFSEYRGHSTLPRSMREDLIEKQNEETSSSKEISGKGNKQAKNANKRGGISE
jgi:Tat protein secretion system quality control protein TatD with DNase activity